MDGIATGKMKRKDLDDVYDEFNDFSLSAPARKIRRLDVELPPIVEEEEPSIPLVFQQPIQNEQIDTNMDGVESMMAEALPHFSLNEEKAIVLYKPVNNPVQLPPSLSHLPYKVHANMIAGLKNQFFWRGNPVTAGEAAVYNEQAAVNNCLAVVPWQPPVYAHATEDNNGISEELMDAVVDEGVSMEVEEIQDGEVAAGIEGEGFHQLPQHCMVPPHLPANPSAHVMRSWG